MSARRELEEALALIDHQCTCSGDCDKERLGASARIRRVLGTQFGTSVAPDFDDPQNTGSKPESH